MLMARMASASNPTTSAGTTGTRRVPDTRAMWVPKGRRPSRAIANSSRMQPAITARVQTEIASAESTRKTLPIVLPSACLMM